SSAGPKGPPHTRRALRRLPTGSPDGRPAGGARRAARPAGRAPAPKRPVARVRRASRRPDGPTRRDVAPAVPPTAPPAYGCPARNGRGAGARLADLRHTVTSPRPAQRPLDTR